MYIYVRQREKKNTKPHQHKENSKSQVF
jgi:hypothetical protein